MAWDDGLTDEQRIAAETIGSPVRMLAGPGTGKTLVLSRRIVFLIEYQNVLPENIVALTFTRAAAKELRDRVRQILPEGMNLPNISTLHSFALRQLIHNRRLLINLPQPLRIADDWEERNIIEENLKDLLDIPRIKQVETLFNQLSSDWESLRADDHFQADPRFIGTWQSHRRVFGYTLRSELVYQLKRSIEQIRDFALDTNIQYLLIDEYQDLNHCDLAIMQNLANRGAEIFAAGDDDQSIYGFRNAFPEGIRNFNRDYQNTQDRPLTICKRCGSNILRIGEFVASLDNHRIVKDLISEDDHQGGDVNLLQFQNENEEAHNIALLCEHLINRENISPSEILILLRSDFRGAYSSVLRVEFERRQIPISINSSSEKFIDTKDGREITALIKLLGTPEDSLAWYSILLLRNNGIGNSTLNAIYNMAEQSTHTFIDTLRNIVEDPSVVILNKARIINEFQRISTFIEENQNFLQNNNGLGFPFNQLIDRIRDFLEIDIPVEILLENFIELNGNSNFNSFEELLLSLQSQLEKVEPGIIDGHVNVLTMHKAKGLSADVVIILAAEDEIIPGRQNMEPYLGDERRLLYVSLTRARHKLFITYCNNRNGQQRMLGKNPGQTRRSLTQFLQNSYLHPLQGDQFINERIS